VAGLHTTQYDNGMSAPTVPSPLQRLLDPITECLTRESAERILNFRADDATQARIDELADKANNGELTDDERTEYSQFVDAIDLIAILQANARRVLMRPTGS